MEVLIAVNLMLLLIFVVCWTTKRRVYALSMWHQVQKRSRLVLPVMALSHSSVISELAA